MKSTALFLDRDGVINVDRGYVHTPEEFEFVEGIFELVAAANEAGYLAIVVTNQAGIGRGYYSGSGCVCQVVQIPSGHEGGFHQAAAGRRSRRCSFKRSMLR